MSSTAGVPPKPRDDQSEGPINLLTPDEMTRHLGIETIRDISYRLPAPGSLHFLALMPADAPLTTNRRAAIKYGDELNKFGPHDGRVPAGSTGRSATLPYSSRRPCFRKRSSCRR